MLAGKAVCCLVGNNRTNESPHFIDNKELIDKSGKLKKGLKYNSDIIAVNKMTWKALRGWYTDNHKIKRSVVQYNQELNKFLKNSKYYISGTEIL